MPLLQVLQNPSGKSVVVVSKHLNPSVLVPHDIMAYVIQIIVIAPSSSKV